VVTWVRGHYGQVLELPEWLRHEGQKSQDRRKLQRKSPIIYVQISLKLLIDSAILHAWAKVKETQQKTADGGSRAKKKI